MASAVPSSDVDQTDQEPSQSTVPFWVAVLGVIYCVGIFACRNWWNDFVVDQTSLEGVSLIATVIFLSMLSWHLFRLGRALARNKV